MKVNLMQGDCLDKLKELDDNSVDSIVTDPPYGLSFMGKAWDKAVPSVEVWEECLRVLKPGGHLLSFAGTRTQHRMAVNIEDAGFEIRDMVAWVYGSGFPKSQNVSKAIDKAAGHKRSTEYEPNYKNSTFGEGMGGGKHGSQSEPPVTQSAKQWDGWGTALKPALEPITVARKPLTGTVAANVMEHGTGAINIDGCRVGGGERPKREIHPLRDNVDYQGNALEGRKDQSLQSSKATGTTTQGRFPANLIHDGSDEVVGLFPITKSAGSKRSGGESDQHSSGGLFEMGNHAGNGMRYGDSGGSAARFFYCPKANKKDRNEGLSKEQANKHPTVKPTDLMCYLCRLVTPPGGTVLDPFMGSGSTGKAARQEGFDFIGIELDPEYFSIAESRIRETEVK